MVFKINIADAKEKGKTFHLDADTDVLIGLKVGDTTEGKDIKSELEGYEFTITGASDKAGFPALKEVDGSALKRVLLKYGKGMRERKPRGMRKRKSVRGNTLSPDTVQINLAVKKAGSRALAEIFPEQNKKKEEKAEANVVEATATTTA